MREITLTVRGDTVHASQHRAGIQGEANATALVVTFDESWDGYAKKITFWDALEQNPVERTLTVDLLVDAAKDTRTYKTTIPGEPLALAGECLLVIDGYVDGARARSMSVQLTVEEAPVADNAGKPADPTPSQAEQLQVQIEAIVGDIQNARVIAAEVKEEAQNAAHAAKLAESYTSHPPTIGDNGNWLEWDGEAYADTGKPSRGEQGKTGAVGPQGRQGVPGERGPSGVYIGSGDMPEDCNVQVDPEGEVITLEDLRGADGYTPKKGVDYYTDADKQEIVDAVLAALPVYNGEVVAV